MAAKELQVKEKQPVPGSAEQTKPGPAFSPNVDIFETENEIVLLADMPGVSPDELDIDLRDNILTVSGEIAPFEGADEQDILVEYETGKYHRQFTLSEIIDQGRIDAKLEKGVLRLNLPKMEKIKPKKIRIIAG